MTTTQTPHKFPSSSALSTQDLSLLTLRLPSITSSPSFHISHLFLLNPYIVKKYLLENNEELEEFIFVMYAEMRRCVREGRFCVEQLKNKNSMESSPFQFIDAFNEEQILGEDKHDEISLTERLPPFHFLHYLELYMKVLNWFNREKEESRNDNVRELFEEFVSHETVKQEILDNFDRDEEAPSVEGDSPSEEVKIHTRLLPRVYEILSYTKSFHLFKLFCEVEEEFVENLQVEDFFSQSSPSSAPKQSSTVRFFQNAFFFHSYLRKQNPLQIIFSASLKAIEDKDFFKLNLLLEPPIFHPLKALIFTVAWDLLDFDVLILTCIYHILFPTTNHPEPVLSGETTHEGLTNHFSKDPALNHACTYLSHLLRLSDWIINHSSVMNEDIDYTTFAHVFGETKTRELREGVLEAHSVAQLAMKKIWAHSLLYALMPWIKKMPPSTLIQFIMTAPPAFEEAQHTYSATLDSIYAYQSIVSLFALVRSDSILDSDDETISSRVSSMRDVVQKISPSTRLAVIRDMINFLLVTEQKDVHGRHSTQHSLSASSEIVEFVLTICRELLQTLPNEAAIEDCILHSDLKHEVDELLWRIDTWNKLTKESTKTLSSHPFEAFLFTSPDSLLISALQNDKFELAQTIYDRYHGEVSDEGRDEFLATSLLNNAKESGELPEDTNRLMDCLFTTGNVENILRRLQQKNPRSGWSNRLLIAMEKAKIAPEIFPLINYSLFQPSADSLEHLINSYPLPSEILSHIVSLAQAEHTSFGSVDKLQQIHRVFTQLSSSDGILPRFLQYLIDTMQKGRHSSVHALLQVFPQTLVEKSAFVDQDYDTAASLADMYTIDLWKVVLASFAQPSVSKKHLSDQMLRFFDDKSKIVGLFARILLDQQERGSEWETIDSLSEEHCPQARIWTNNLKQVKQIQNDLLHQTECPLTSFTQATQQLTQLPLKALIEITTDPIHPLNIHIPLQEGELDIEAPGTLPLSVLFRFANVKSVFSHFKRVFTTWSVDDCVNLLRHLLSSLYQSLSKNRRRSRMRQNPLLLEVAALLQKIIVMNQIANVCSEFESWHQVLKALDNPDDLVEVLLEKGRFDLAQSVLRAAEDSVDPSLYHQVQSRQLLAMLSNDDQTQSINFLDDMPGMEAFQACCKALDDTHNPSTQLFLCKYIITALNDEISSEILSRYNRIFLTLKLLSVFDHASRELFYDRLKTKPDLIVENLLLTGRIDDVALVLRHVPELHDDHLLISYGLKALAMKLPNQTHWKHDLVWGDDEEKDEQVRNNHFYDQAPSVVLSKRILDMVRESGRAGEGLLTICQEIARLSSSNFNSKYEHSQLVEQILHFAKLCFLRDADGHEFLPAIDTLQSRLELLKQIFNADCGIEVTLPDLGKQSKTRQIRDSLIEADQMELALDVATSCRIEREPVWIEWGISLLSLGMYEEAREKLRHCTGLPHSQKLQLLMQIIQRLQMPSKVKHSQFLSTYSECVQHQLQLKNVVEQLRAKLSKGESIRSHPYLSKSVVKSNIDEPCFEEARFYCELFGSPKDYLLFLTKQGRVVDAISYAVNNQVPQAVFVNAIVVHCHHHGLMDYLFDSVANSHLKTQRHLVKPYWTAACKYFDQKGAVRLLYDLQCFMQDEARAALTCIRMFLDDTQQEQSQLLTLAKSHLGKALQQTMTRRKSVLSAEEIATYMQTINLEMEIIQHSTIHQRLQEGKLSLFGSERKRKRIAEIMLEESPALAFRVINNYNLPAVKLYCRTLKALAHKKKYNEIESLLKQILVTLSLQEKDAVVENLIYVLVKEVKDIRTAEKHIAKLTSDSKMVRACLVCHKYKAAYVIATRASNRNKETDVREILKCLNQLADGGGKSGKLVHQHCESWLEKYVPKGG